MIDKTDMEIRAIKDARRFLAEVFTELSLMSAFQHRTAAEIADELRSLPFEPYAPVRQQQRL